MMQRILRIAVVALVLGACESGSRATPGLDPSHAAALRETVRTYMQSVADGVSKRGPAAWRDYFLARPEFFMAAEGRMVFPNSDSASRGVDVLAKMISQIQLRWTDSVRVDPLGPRIAMVGAPYLEVRIDSAGHRVEERGYFTALVVNETGDWKFRDAHWSVLNPSAP